MHISLSPPLRSTPLEIKHKVWLEQSGRVVFGQGREALLKAIDECRSLNAAAKKLNMSYRAAWGRLKASEDRLGIKLVEHTSGKAMHLTDEARKLLSEFEILENKVNSLITEAGSKLNLLGQSKTNTHKNKGDYSNL
jgi:molybdate transport system regulatory protein